MEKTFTCSGDDGDVTYALASIKAAGGGHLRLTPSTNMVRSAYTPSKVENFASFVRVQPYIHSCEYATLEQKEELLKQGAVNIDGFRRQFKGGPNVIDWISDYLGLGRLSYDPWLTVPEPRMVAPVVIHRSPRYRNDKFPWWDVPKGFAGKLVMVGLPEEHRDFCSSFGDVPYHHTKDFLELAQVIAGSKLFVGNQSAPMAVALGLGVNLVQEVCHWTPNCQLAGRKNAQFVKDWRHGTHWPRID